MIEAHAFARFGQKYKVSPTGCWLCTGGVAGPEYKTGRGYGEMYYKGKIKRAHRLAYEHFIGPIPEGLTIDHLCRVTTCVNPSHLEAVTQRENSLRGHTIARRNASRTHCPQGHAYEGANLYVDPRGNRQCRKCRRVAFLRFHERRLAA